MPRVGGACKSKDQALEQPVAQPCGGIECPAWCGWAARLHGLYSHVTSQWSQENGHGGGNQALARCWTTYPRASRQQAQRSTAGMPPHMAPIVHLRSCQHIAHSDQHFLLTQLLRAKPTSPDGHTARPPSTAVSAQPPQACESPLRRQPTMATKFHCASSVCQLVASPCLPVAVQPHIAKRLLGRRLHRRCRCMSRVYS